MSSIFFRSEGSGRSIILIHGFCETSEIWNSFSKKLAESYQVISIDLPGFGASPLPSIPISVDQIAELINDLIDELKIKKPILIGHSLGGYISLAMAALSEEKFEAIVLFHSSAHPDSVEKIANRNKVIEFVRTHGVNPFVDTFVPGLFWDKNHPAILYIDSIAQKTSQETLINYAMAMRDRPSRIEFLKSIHKPVLHLGGKRDTFIPADITLELGELNPLSSSFLLDQTAHMGMFEEPNEALMAIKRFIDSLAV